LHHYQLHGLRVQTDAPLEGYRAVPPPGSGPDLRVELAGTRPVPDEAPDGPLVQSHVSPSPSRRGSYSTASLPGGGWLVRAHGAVDFELGPDLAHARAWLSPGHDPGLVWLLVPGLLVSVLLGLQGELVLHASAVEAGGRVVALSAPPGVGKSTVAALVCSVGARLVTDDVLRVGTGPGVARCHLGAAGIRLRRPPGELSRAYAATPAPTTSDGRYLLEVPASERDLAPLNALVLPVPAREREELDLRALTGHRAVMELARALRVQGWRDAEVNRRTFLAITKLAATVPVLRALVPWGPPFDPAVSLRLLEETGLAPRPRTA
jgi:hypothetical protein